MAETAEFQKRLQSIEELLSTVEAAADPNLRSKMRDLVQALMDLHGAGLERALELIGETDAGSAIVSKLGRDELVGSLLVLYGLHPMNLEARIDQGLERARRLIHARQGEIDVLSLDGGCLRLRVRAEGHGCGSTSAALKEIVEAAVYEAAPDIAMLVVESEDEKQTFVPLAMLKRAPAAATTAGGFALAGAAEGEL
jgi:Fe-S cluster biogenesis protein NfuA